MFDQILEMVKEHMGNHPDVAGAVSATDMDAVHNEVAEHITRGLASQAGEQGGVGGLLSQLESGLTSGSPITGAIEGGLISSLTSKFGLPPAVTGAISGALPGLLQKFAHRANDPNDSSVTPESIGHSFSSLNLGNLGGLGNLFK